MGAPRDTAYLLATDRLCDSDTPDDSVVSDAVGDDDKIADIGIFVIVPCMIFVSGFLSFILGRKNFYEVLI